MSDRIDQLDAERIRGEAADWAVRLADTASADARAAFERWLAADPRHQLAYARVAERFDAARILRHSTQFAAPSATPARRYLFGAAALALAASLAFGFVSGDLARLVAGASGARSGTAAAWTGTEQLATRKGQIRSMPLPDGTMLTLDTASAVRVAFTASRRRVSLLRGRVRFAVHHDRRPFTVFAGNGTITDRGTVFDVALEPDGDVRVQLLRGAVDIAEPSYPGRAAVRHLRPGTQLVYGITALPAAPQPLAPGAAGWPQGIVDLDDVALPRLLESANRYADRPIVLGDPALGSLRVSGRFGVADPERLASDLAALFDLHVVHRADAIVLARS